MLGLTQQSICHPDSIDRCVCVCVCVWLLPRSLPLCNRTSNRRYTYGFIAIIMESILKLSLKKPLFKSHGVICLLRQSPLPLPRFSDNRGCLKAVICLQFSTSQVSIIFIYYTYILPDPLLFHDLLHTS